MQTISKFMAADHSRSDQLYADDESALLAEKFEACWVYISAFDLEIRRHFDMEEEFLALEGVFIVKTGQTLTEYQKISEFLELFGPQVKVAIAC